MPHEVLFYILMWRTGNERMAIRRGKEQDTEENIRYWNEWLNTKDEKKELGYHVSSKIRELVKSRVENVEYSNKKLVKRLRRYKEFRKILRSMKLSPSDMDSWRGDSRFRDKLQEIRFGNQPDFIESLQIAGIKINKALEIFKAEDI